MEQNEKPYQSLAWLATAILIIAATLASFVPELEYHHWAFISANTLWVQWIVRVRQARRAVRLPRLYGVRQE